MGVLKYFDENTQQWENAAIGSEGPVGPQGERGFTGAGLPPLEDVEATDVLEFNGTDWVGGQRATTGKAIAMAIVFG